ncbi:MAG: 50S ribosomal protein L32 [Bacteriovoracia bacterium]
MATPKKKVSRGRRDRRRYASGNRLAKPTVVVCPNCSDQKRPHTICGCGWYAGKAVINVQTARA